MNTTNQQLLAAVDRMRATDKEKQAMREAIKCNDPNAKFAILGTLRRMERRS